MLSIRDDPIEVFVKDLGATVNARDDKVKRARAFILFLSIFLIVSFIFLCVWMIENLRMNSDEREIMRSLLVLMEGFEERTHSSVFVPDTTDSSLNY